MDWYKSLRDLSIKRKLIFIVIATSSIVAILACAAFIIYDHYSLKKQIVNRLEIMANVISLNCTAAVTFEDNVDATETLNALSAENRIEAARIYATDSTLFAEYVCKDFDGYLPPLSPDFNGHLYENRKLYFSQPIYLNGDKIGTIFLMGNLSELSDRIRIYLQIVAVIIFASLMVALGITFRLQKIVTKPISHLADVAKQVSDSDDYSIRAKKYGNDEMGFLVTKFNDMLSQIEKSNFSLLEAQSKLEDRVKERTQELESEVNERKLAQHLLQKAHLQLNATLNALPDLLFEIDARGVIVDYRAPDIDLLYVHPEDFINRPISETLPENVAAIVYDALGKAKQTGHIDGVQYSLESPKGLFWWELSLAAKSESGTTECNYIALIRDITDRKLAEERLKDSLHEKEVLLKEIHHRVKNNLQVITSLLNLQSNKIYDDEMKSIFRDSQSRVKSMALIHEKLYRSDDLNNIDFCDYTQNLANFLTRTFEIDIHSVKLQIDIDNIFLSVDIAVPLGLIINELISNCFKHAFPNKMPGEIYLSFGKLNQQEYILRVTDNGVGLPEQFNPDNLDSLGIQLIYTLTNQLSGQLSMTSDSGACFEIILPIPASQNQGVVKCQPGS